MLVEGLAVALWSLSSILSMGRQSQYCFPAVGPPVVHVPIFKVESKWMRWAGKPLAR